MWGTDGPVDLGVRAARPDGGGYQWWYLDVETADVTVVAILFDGFPFLNDRAGAGGLALDVYRHGKRCLSVMALGAPATVGADGVAAAGSRLCLTPGRITLEIDAWAPFPGTTVRGTVSVEGAAADVQAWPGPHTWEPLVPRGEGRVHLDLGGRRLDLGGTGYADHDRDPRPMPEGLRGWVWARLHQADHTTVLYRLDDRDAGSHSVRLEVSAQGEVKDCSEADVRLEGWQRPSAFGLRVPRALRSGDLRLAVGRPSLTAPFYARLPTEPQGLAEIGRPAAIRWPLLRHLVAMRPTGPGPHPADGHRILHRAERRFLGHRLPPA